MELHQSATILPSAVAIEQPVQLGAAELLYSLVAVCLFAFMVRVVQNWADDLSKRKGGGGSPSSSRTSRR